MESSMLDPYEEREERSGYGGILFVEDGTFGIFVCGFAEG
jgi:hypothetical protein